jgi:hypothetical protein
MTKKEMEEEKEYYIIVSMILIRENFILIFLHPSNVRTVTGMENAPMRDVVLMSAIEMLYNLYASKFLTLKLSTFE